MNFTTGSTVIELSFYACNLHNESGCFPDIWKESIVTPLYKTSAVSEHAGYHRLWDEVKFIDRDPHWHLRRVKEVIHTRLHPNNQQGNGIKIPEAWMPTIRQHDNRLLPQRTVEGSVSSSHNANNALDRNALTMSEVCDTPITNSHGGANSSSR